MEKYHQKTRKPKKRKTATPGPSGINTCHDCGDVVDARNPLVEEPLPEVPEDTVQETPRQEDNETIQENYLFPIIHLHWKMYQESLLQKVNDECEGKITVAGDARHDSMGHNAKYGAYSVLCSDIAKIIHFSLVQRNQADSSNAMEYVGFKNCMEFLLEENGLPISTFVSDRHTSICSHMKKELKDIKHYFDLWHLKKKIRKVLVKLAKEKNCEVLKTWIKPCENHLYWSAMSTQSGKGDIIWAKFKSFLSHVVNKHDGLDEPLFNKCGHGQIRDRTWLEKGSVAHDKMVAELTKASLIRGIKQASPLYQTSGLEGFHSVVNFFAPKMIAFSYVGMYCRHILAILHFNSNAYRDIKYKPDGTEQVRVSYPKFKYGEATVRNVRVAKKFGKT
ncbi:uncharacterized protein LOC110250843 [Exaiptasia diaphana]|uniref:Mutator-like transposase domain-containing protein n=1 Tax=Exaiptasia diaphana TaxID=2652724 RepID=A0A913YSS2_EXADI|nr:uncharacterized protein LOC110250843 [Exaiptasia diaphana]